MEETGKTEEEIDRALLWKKARELKNDTSCYLAVDIASNIVAKGTIMMYNCETTTVMLEICLQAEALLPCPLEDEFILQVKDGVGHIINWPRHLVIRCSDLENVVVKPKRKSGNLLASKIEKKPKTKPVEVDGKEMEKKKWMESKKEKEPIEIDGKSLEKLKGKENETMQKRMTREQRKTRIRVEKSAVLTMTRIMVDGQVSKVDSIRVQCVDDLFGYDSFTYLSWEDFEAVFTLDELTGFVIASYMMYLYEQIKNGPKEDRGICFVSPSATSPSQRKSKSKHIDDSSIMVAGRLAKRQDNDIILLPYNPGRHWVLAVLDMKTATCYYLNSLRHNSVNPQLRQIIDAAMILYAVQGGSKHRVKVNWVNARCPCQPGSTECGYYMLKFMKEIVDYGLEILVNDNVGGGKEVYNDDDIDAVREEWSSYVSTFIFR